MEDIFLILFLLSFVGLVVGLIKPKKAVFWSKNKTRKKVVIGYLSAILLFFIAFGVMVDVDEVNKEADESLEQLHG